ncbi:MAG: glycosyltransferase family 9 protein [Burkholderiaceae bacterium]
MKFKQSRLYQIECARRTLALLANDLPLTARRGPIPSGKPRIGILKRGGIGDWIVFHQALESIANDAPDAEISVFAEKQNAEIINLLELVDHLHIIDPNALRKNALKKRTLLNQVRQSGFDVWIDADLSRTRLGDAMALACRSPIRIGYAANHTAPCHAWLQTRLFNHLIPDNFGKTHMSVRMLEISKRFREIWPIDGAAMSRDVRERKISGLRRFAWSGHASNVMIVAPSASIAMRIWPIERSADVIEHLHRTRGLKPVIVGGPADQAVCRRLLAMVRDTGAVDMSARLSLVQSLALIGESRLLLANESGPMHMGRALGTPTVVVASGADFTNYLRYPEQRANYRVVTAEDDSCFDCSWQCIYKRSTRQAIKPCLDAIRSDAVIDAIESMLDAPRDDRPGP